jgi:hypothetical protein
MQDLKQILKGCFCRNRGIKKTSTELDHRNINEPSTLPVDEHRDGSRTGDIFERTGDKMAEHAKSLPSLDGRLRRGVLPLAGGHPEGDASPPPEQRTLSNESSNTAQEASNDSDPPANVGARPKNFLRRWKAKRAAAAHERAMMRRRVEQDAALHRNVQDLLSSDGIPLRFDQSSGLGLFEM